MIKLVGALLFAAAAAQVTPTYAPTAAESMAPSYAPSETTYIYDPTSQPTVAPSFSPVPTGTKAAAVTGILGTTGLTIAECIANKDVFQLAICNQVGIPPLTSCDQVSVGCNVASTRRRLTDGNLAAEIDYAINFPPDSGAAISETIVNLEEDGFTEEVTTEIQTDAGCSDDPTASVVCDPAFSVDSNTDITITDPIIETDIPIDQPTAAPMTLAPTADDDTLRKLSEEQAPARKALYFIDYGAPGTGAAPTHGRRLSATAVGCHAVTWAPGECAMLLSDVPHLCGSMATCAGAICGGKDFVIDGKPACLARGEIDFTAAPRSDVYALSKEEAPAAAIVRGPASRKLLFAAAAYGSEVLTVLQDIWHR